MGSSDMVYVKIIFVTLIMIIPKVLSNTSSDFTSQCPARCDMIKEIDAFRGEMQILRQLLNQESLLRMNLDQQMQNQKKSIEDMEKKLVAVSQPLSDRTVELKANSSQKVDDDKFSVKEINGSMEWKANNLAQNAKVQMESLKTLDARLSILNASLVAFNQTFLEKNVDISENLSQKVDAINTIVGAMNSSLLRRINRLTSDLSQNTKIHTESLQTFTSRLSMLNTSLDLKTSLQSQKVNAINIAVGAMNSSLLENIDRLKSDLSQNTKVQTESLQTFTSRLSMLNTSLDLKTKTLEQDIQQERNYRTTKLVNIENKLLEMKQMVRKFNESATIQRSSNIAFSATNSSRSSGDILFYSVSINLGNAYDKWSGAFTAPSTGVYVFQWTVATEDTKECNNVLTINGKQVSWNLVDSATSPEDSSGSQTIITKLDTGDKVRIKSYTCNHIHGLWSSFSGFRYA